MTKLHFFIGGAATVCHRRAFGVAWTNDMDNFAAEYREGTACLNCVKRVRRWDGYPVRWEEALAKA